MSQSFEAQVAEHPPLQRGFTVSTGQRGRIDRMLAQLRQLHAELDPANDTRRLTLCATPGCECWTRFGRCAGCAHPWFNHEGTKGTKL